MMSPHEDGNKILISVKVGEGVFNFSRNNLLRFLNHWEYYWLDDNLPKWIYDYSKPTDDPLSEEEIKTFFRKVIFNSDLVDLDLRD